MRRSMRVIPFLLAIGALPALATPAYYTIAFTLTSGSPLPDSGSFYYDSSTLTFTSFDVVWDGDAFDLTSAANTAPFLGPVASCVTSGTSGPQQVFLIMTACPVAYWEANGSAVSATMPSFLFDEGAYGTVFSYGVVVITPGLPTAPPTTATGAFTSTISPEPSSWALMLIGLGLVMRKRISALLWGIG